MDRPLQIDPEGISVNATGKLGPGNTDPSKLSSPRPSPSADRFRESSDPGIHKHYFLVLPEFFGDFSPLAVDNNSLELLKGHFDASIPVTFQSGGGLEEGVTENWVMRGDEIANPRQMDVHMSILSSLKSALELGERALSGNLDFEGFKQGLAGVQLQADTRDNLVDSLFEAVEISKDIEDVPQQKSNTPGTGDAQKPSDSMLEGILDMVDTGQPEQQPASGQRPSGGKAADGVGAVSKFINAAGQDHTGFRLRKESGRACLKELRMLVDSCSEDMYGNPAIRPYVEVILTLHKLLKKVKSRQRQKMHLLPGTLFNEQSGSRVSEYINEIMTADPVTNRCMALTVCDPVDPSGESWAPVLRNAGKLADSLRTPVFLQLATAGKGDDQLQAPLLSSTMSSFKTSLAEKLGRELPQRMFLFGGSTALSYERGDVKLSGWKPAALNFLEGIIIHAEAGWQLENDMLLVEDQDVIIRNGKPLVTRHVLPSETWTSLRDLGINAVNSFANRDVVMFLAPLPLG